VDLFFLFSFTHSTNKTISIKIRKQMTLMPIIKISSVYSVRNVCTTVSHEFSFRSLSQLNSSSVYSSSLRSHVVLSKLSFGVLPAIAAETKSPSADEEVFVGAKPIFWFSKSKMVYQYLNYIADQIHSSGCLSFL
jgi:hypothetical protein